VGHRDSHQEAQGLAPPLSSPSSTAAAVGNRPPYPPPLPQHHPPPDDPRPSVCTLGQPEVEAHSDQQHGVAFQTYA